MTLLFISFLAFLQNVTFSLVSRSRNRDNLTYHAISAILANFVWFFTFRELVTHDMNWTLFVPYTCGTVLGSLFGVKISMKIEKWIGAV
jgi:uncharacterized membrane protein YfcA